MRSKHVSVLAVIIVSVACSGTAYNDPPGGSFEIVHVNLKDGGALIQVQGATVTPEFFASRGIQPLVGRLFIDGDHMASPPGVLVLSNEFWSAHFGASPGIVGRTIELDGRPMTVVGVTPRGFSFPAGTQLWMPKSQVAR